LKVLFLAYDTLPDYHQDLVAHGIAELIGPENLLVHPRLERYHAPAPPDVRQTAMAYPNLPEQRDATLEELAHEADAVVVGSIRGSSLRTFRQLLELGFDKPRAALDGLDDYYVREIVRHVDVYFKRETLVHSLRLRLKFPLRQLYWSVRPHEMWGGGDGALRRQVAVARAGVPKLVPLPFAAVPVDVDRAPERTHDVVFLGAATHPLRARIVEEVRALRAEGLDVVVPEESLSEQDRYRARITWAEYMRALTSSKIAISVRGDGYDTYRYWEIPYAGALLLAETPQTVIPDNFVDGREAVFAHPNRLVERARELLASGGIDEIAAAGHAKLLERHLSRHRAETVLERLASVR
jgi:glycosyl transferase family 1